jgi:hypothetical protein
MDLITPCNDWRFRGFRSAPGISTSQKDSGIPFTLLIFVFRSSANVELRCRLEAALKQFTHPAKLNAFLILTNDH